MSMSSTSRDNSTRVVITAVLGNLSVAIAKLIAWLITASPSLLAEFIHSVADTVNQILLYIGIKQGQGIPTREFPWGRGRSRYLWNLISAVGVLFFGFGLTVYHGIQSLWIGTYTRDLQSVILAFGILSLALIIEGYSLMVAIRQIRMNKKDDSLWTEILYGDDPTTVAVLLEDSIAVFGVLLAFVGLGLSHYFQSVIPDAITTVLIGILLGSMAVTLVMTNGRLLIGVALEANKEEEIIKFLETLPSVEKVISLKSQILAPDNVRIMVEIEFHGSNFIHRKQIENDADDIREGEDPLPILVDTVERTVRIVGNEINRLEREVTQQFPEIIALTIVVN